MGSTFAPSLASLYMYSFEKQFILDDSNSYKNEIRLWKRYIDDILVVWHGETSRAVDFHNLINTLDPFLKFTNTFPKMNFHFWIYGCRLLMGSLQLGPI